MSSSTSWSEGFVGGLAFYILGSLLTGIFIVGFPAFVISVVFFVVGFAISWRSTFRLRDIGAYCALTLISLSLVLNLVEIASGQLSVYSTDYVPVILTSIVVAMALGVLALRVLRRSKRVPQFG